jgi:hypothetical protein
MCAVNRRHVIKTAGAALVYPAFSSLFAETVRENSHRSDSYEWIRLNRTLIAEAYNPPFYPSFDYIPEKGVDIAVQLNCDSMRYPAASYLAYFPTESGYPTHPDLKGDPMRRTVGLLERAGLHKVVYIPLNHPFMSVTSNDPRYPGWSKKFADGKPMITAHYGFGNFYEGCLNSPLRDVIRKLVLEVHKNYAFDVLYFDGPYQGMDHSADYCHCEYCETAYQKRFGKRIPLQPGLALEDAIEYTNWMRDEVAIAFFRELRTALREIRDVPVLFNDTSLLVKTEQWRSHAIAVADGFMFEAADTPEQKLFNLQLGRSTGKAIWTYLGHHTEYNREHIKDKTVRGWYSYPLEGEELLLDGATAIAAGVGCVYWGMQRFFYEPKAPLEYESGRFLKTIFDFQQAHSALLRSLQSKPQVGILIGDQTINWYQESHFLPEAYSNYYHGAFNLLKSFSFESEPFLDWQMSPELLQKYQMVFVPNAACLSTAQCEMLREYVRRGGVLVATHLTSIADEYGRIRSDFGLADLFAASFVDPQPIEYPDLYLQPVDGDLVPQDPQLMRLRATGGVVLANTLDRGNHRRLGPAVIRNSFGRGHVLYIGSGLEAIYEETRMDPIRLYLGSLLSPFLEGEQSYRIDHIPGLTPHYMASDKTLVLHLLADTGDKDMHYKAREYFLPLSQIKARIRLPRSAKSVILMRSNQTLQAVHHGQWIEVLVPEVLVHEAIRVDLA